MASNGREIEAARQDRTTNDLAHLAVNSSTNGTRLLNYLSNDVDRRRLLIGLSVLRQVGIIREQLILFHLFNGTYRDLGDLCQVLATNYFTEGRRNIYAMRSDINGVYGLNAYEAEVLSRNIRRLYDGSCQLLDLRTLNSSTTLSAESSLSERLGARIAANGRGTVTNFSSLVSIVCALLILSLESGLSITIVDVRGVLRDLCVDYVTRR